MNQHESGKKSASGDSQDVQQISDTSLGTLVWGKLGKFPWWPGMIVDPADCKMTLTGPEHVCIYWFKDCRITNVPKHNVQQFKSNFQHFFEDTKRKTLTAAIVLAIKEEAKRMNMDIEEWSDERCIKWAKDGFKTTEHAKLTAPAALIPDFVVRDLNKIKNYNLKEELGQQEERKISGQKRKVDTVDDLPPNEPMEETLEAIEKIKKGSLAINMMCLGCKSLQVELVSPHPLLKGSLCRSCKDTLRESMQSGNADDNACTICGTEGNGFICSVTDCKRVYCMTCIELLGGHNAKDKIQDNKHWRCFICHQYDASVNGIIEKRVNDKTKSNQLAKFFASYGHIRPFPTVPKKKEEINVLSLFDGIGTGFVVLQNLGFKIGKYYAAEVHDDAIKVSCVNHLDKIEQIGDVRLLTEEKLKGLGRIDLLIGGSPCGELSLVNPARRGLFDPEASGILFFEYCRILRTLQLMNTKQTLFWLYENTAAMPLSYLRIISRNLGCDEVAIDASWMSAQKRKRYFWGNIPELGRSFNYSEDDHTLNEYLDPGLGRVATVKKLRTVTTQSNSLYQGKMGKSPVKERGRDALVTTTELERVFGLPCHYTDVANMSAQKRQKLLGRAWSVPVICHILKPLKPYFLCSDE